ncbi:MAG: ABC transporter ATP-binding protein [Burkholderiaceae bacterium]|nr:MAG: ABC transporter ATP-binding protein [Burkholderiaceae bacterium]
MSEIHLEAVQLAVQIGGKQVCNRLNLQIQTGEIWALLGENGVGKSTLMATLAGARLPQQGALHLQGQRLADYAPRLRAQRLGWLAQRDDDPFPATVLETVLAGRHPHLDRLTWESEEDAAIARAELARVDLAGFATRDVTTLSGGERRRVSLATLLAQQTLLLLLDEPLSQLDLRHQLVVLRLLRQLAQIGCSIVFISHDPNHALQIATHALLLFGKGRTVSGPIHEVVTPQSIAELYRCAVREVAAGGQRLIVPVEGEP